MPQTINYSDGSRVEGAVPVVWEDYHSEARGVRYRAFWADSPNGTRGSTIIGYCSPGGSHRTIKACAAEIRRLYPGETIYRNGKPVYLDGPRAATARIKKGDSIEVGGEPWTVLRTRRITHPLAGPQRQRMLLVVRRRDGQAEWIDEPTRTP